MCKIIRLLKIGMRGSLIFTLSFQFFSYSWAGKEAALPSLDVLQMEAELASNVASGFLQKIRTDKEISEQDRRAFEWLKKATVPGDVIVQFKLGRMYAQGIICEKDKRQARECFELAIREGNAIANFLKKAEEDPTFTSNFPFPLAKKREEGEEKED